MDKENIFHQEDVLSGKTRYRDLIVRTWPFVAKHRGLLILLVVLVFLHTAISRILPNLIGYAVDHVIVSRELQKLWPICLTYLALELIRFCFIITETYYFQVLGQKVIFDMRS